MSEEKQKRRVRFLPGSRLQQLCWSLAINSLNCQVSEGGSGERPHICHLLLETNPPGACKAPLVKEKTLPRGRMLVTGSRRSVECRESGQSSPSSGMGTPSPWHWEQLANSCFLSRRMWPWGKTSVQPGAVGDSLAPVKEIVFCQEIWIP